MAKSKLKVNELVKLLTDVYDVHVGGGDDKIIVRLVDLDGDKRHEGEGSTFECALQACVLAFAKSEADESARLMQEASSAKDLVMQLTELCVGPAEA
jgi:hypothetical protein